MMTTMFFLLWHISRRFSDVSVGSNVIFVNIFSGKFVGDTSCEKLPVEICGAGCTTEEGPEECHDKTRDVVTEVPEEVCDLNPQKTCRFATRLVPSLRPKHECSLVPKQVKNSNK